MPEEREVVISYTVTHYSDGSTDVVPSDPEKMSVEDCYEDIEYTAKLLDDRRRSNSVYLATQKAIGDFFKTMSEMKNPNKE